MKLIVLWFIILLHEVCFSMCFTPRLASTSVLKNEGFHRHIETQFETATLPPDLINCQWAVDETIPSGAYVDPDQLKNLERSGVSPYQFEVLKFVNVEAAEHNSEPNRLLVYVNETFSKSNKLNVNFPFHLRYHRPLSGGGYTLVKVNNPSLLVKCEGIILETKIVRAPCCQYCNNCDWNVVPTIEDNKDIFVEVPVGNLDHKGFVAFVTLMITVGGCMFIVTPVWPLKIF